MSNVALIFPGQGAQFVGMGKDFYDNSPEAKEIFDKAGSIIPGLTDIIFNGPQEKLTSTAFCQPAIVTFSIAALEALKVNPKFREISPRYAAGLSLGEYSALVACGALGFEDTIRLVERRSFYMDQACQTTRGTMAAVIGFDRDQLAEVCTETGAQVANFNSNDQTVISGEVEKVQAASEIIKERGAKRVIPLSVSGAFHSSLMQPAVAKFEEDLKKVTIQSPEFPIISNVNGLQVDDSSIIKTNLIQQITSSVQWVKTIEHIASQGITTFLEIGPGSVLKGLIRKINKDLTVYNIEKTGDIEKLLAE